MDTSDKFILIHNGDTGPLEYKSTWKKGKLCTKFYIMEEVKMKNTERSNLFHPLKYSRKNVSNHVAYKSLKDYTWGSSFTGIKFFSIHNM